MTNQFEKQDASRTLKQQQDVPQRFWEDNLQGSQIGPKNNIVQLRQHDQILTEFGFRGKIRWAGRKLHQAFLSQQNSGQCDRNRFRNSTV